MAYTVYDDTKPANADAGTAVCAEILANTNAVRDMLGFGGIAGVDLSVSGGTAEEPSQYIFTKHGGAVLGRASCTWASGRLTVLRWERYNGATYDTILAADQTFTYDGSGNLTATANAGGIPSLLWYAIGKAKAILVSLAAHIAATGTAVHGLGDVSPQNKSAIDITGGTVKGVALEYTTARGKVVALGNMTGTVNIDWTAGDIFVGTVTGTLTLTETNRPGHSTVGTLPGGSLTLALTNPGAFGVTWPAAWKWPSGVTPSRTASGLDLYEAFCYDATLVHASQAQRDSR